METRSVNHAVGVIKFLVLLSVLFGTEKLLFATQLQAIHYEKPLNNRIAISLEFNQPTVQPLIFDTDNPQRITLLLHDTTYQVAQTTTFPSDYFLTHILTTQAGESTKITLHLSQPVKYQVNHQKNHIKIWLETEQETPNREIHSDLPKNRHPESHVITSAPKLAQKSKVAFKKRYTGEPLSLHFQDISVRSVLQLLADFTDLNIVVSDSVSGNITLRLKDVPWDQAMALILKTKGLSMRREESILFIAPTEELAAREKLVLESQMQKEELVPLHSALIPIHYAKASDLSTLLKSPQNRLLSDRGHVTLDIRTNTLLIQDTPKKLLEIRDLIHALDTPVRQVLIESRIVIANDDFAQDLGVRLGMDYLDNGTNNAAFGGGLAGDIAWNPSIGQTVVENPSNSGNQALLVNLPQTLSTSRGGAINFVLGKVGQHLLRLELSAMQQEGKGEIISSPRVITANQNKAVIKQGVEIPYQETTSGGATSVSFKEAVLQMEVTPHITPDDRVIMDLKVNKDNPDFTRAVLGVPPVDTRELETSVLVDDGETIVLGGVFERTQSHSLSKVPLFGDLPVIGTLFRQEQIQDENNELLIFVTPRILQTHQVAKTAETSQ